MYRLTQENSMIRNEWMLNRQICRSEKPAWKKYVEAFGYIERIRIELKI